jgi:hypothetical protein
VVGNIGCLAQLCRRHHCHTDHELCSAHPFIRTRKAVLAVRTLEWVHRQGWQSHLYWDVTRAVLSRRRLGMERDIVPSYWLGSGTQEGIPKQVGLCPGTPAGGTVGTISFQNPPS